MKTDLFLGIDQGSSSTKACLIDSAGIVRHEFSLPVPERIENGRCVEQDPEGILSSVVEGILRSKSLLEPDEAPIKGAGIAVQRSGVLAWRSEDGVPLHPVISWADTRTYPTIQNFGRGIERISVQTGIPTLPNFAAPKIALLQRQFLEPSTYVATLDSFLLHRLSKRNVFATDDTMAARTMLYSLDDRNWNQGLCRDFKVDQKRLPRIHPSLAPHTTFEDVPIIAMIGDQQAALIGRSGSARRPLLNLGSIASLMIDTGTRVVREPGLMTSVLASRLTPGGYSREFRFMTEVTSAVTGAVLSEIVKRKWVAEASEIDSCCNAAWQRDPAGRSIVYFVNRRPGISPWENGIPNVIVNKPTADDSDRVRAVVENVAHLVLRLLAELEDKGLFKSDLPDAATVIDISGGGSEIDYLVQYLADCSGYTFHRLANREAGARGAALCAWMSSCGQFDASPLNIEPPIKTFTPETPDRRRRYVMWQRLEQDVLNRNLPHHAIVEDS